MSLRPEKESLLEPMRIRSTVVDPPLVLAPMAGYTTSSFRRLARRNRCGMVVSEVIAAKALIHRNPKTEQLLYFTEEERPIALQVVVGDPREAEEAVTLLQARRPDVIDLNYGCPKPKITKRGEGAAILEDPARALEVVSAAVQAATVPVTVKMRLPRKFDPERFADFCLALAERGAAALTIHPRTVSDGFKGKARWEVFPALTRILPIPVVASGDVRTPRDAEHLFESGCSGVMIGRAAIGNPLIFRWIAESLSGEAAQPPSLEERYRAGLTHFAYLSEEKGAQKAVLEMRKQLTRYLKGLPSLHRLVGPLLTLRDPERFRKELEALEPFVRACA